MHHPGVDHEPESISWLARRTSADLWNITHCTREHFTRADSLDTSADAGLPTSIRHLTGCSRSARMFRRRFS
jgi:hypothetical protein